MRIFNCEFIEFLKLNVIHIFKTLLIFLITDNYHVKGFYGYIYIDINFKNYNSSKLLKTNLMEFNNYQILMCFFIYTTTVLFKHKTKHFEI